MSFFPVGSHLDFLSSLRNLGIKVYDAKSCHLESPLPRLSTMRIYPGTCKLDSKVPRDVAFKFPKADILIEKPRIRKMAVAIDGIATVVKLLASVPHPNIIKCFGAMFNDLTPGLIIERPVDSLGNYLADKKVTGAPVDWHTKARFCSQILSALEALHAANILHGNLDSENVLVVERKGEAVSCVLSDLGFSTFVASGLGWQDFNRTVTEALRPPEYYDLDILEVWRARSNVDLYFYGMLVWVIARDACASFDGMDVYDIRRIKRSESLLKAMPLPEGAPSEFSSVISSSAKFLPQDRASLGDLKEILKRLLPDEFPDNLSIKYDVSDYDDAKVKIQNDFMNFDNSQVAELPYIKSVSYSDLLKEAFFHDYRRTAQTGDVWAQFYLARCFQIGFGVDRDQHMAAQWYTEFLINSADVPGRRAEKFNVTVFDINHCEIGAMIGAGASMTVREGFCEIDGLRRPVAFKFPTLIVTNTTRESAIKSAFMDIRQEVRLMSQLGRHPNVVQFFGLVFDNIKPAIIVELAQFGDLGAYLSEKKEDYETVGWPIKARFGVEIANGVLWGHSRHIVFGDLKCANILVFTDPDDDNNDRVIVKISDFGYSNSTYTVKNGQFPGGTQPFSPPEYADDTLSNWKGKQIGDVYSFGLVVHQIANDGNVPLGVREHHEYLEIKKTDDHLMTELHADLPDDTPREFLAVIAMATKRLPDKRTSLKDLISVLRPLYVDDARDSGLVQ